MDDSNVYSIWSIKIQTRNSRDDRDRRDYSGERRDSRDDDRRRSRDHSREHSRERNGSPERDARDARDARDVRDTKDARDTRRERDASPAETNGRAQDRHLDDDKPLPKMKEQEKPVSDRFIITHFSDTKRESRTT